MPETQIQQAGNAIEPATQSQRASAALQTLLPMFGKPNAEGKRDTRALLVRKVLNQVTKDLTTQAQKDAAKDKTASSNSIFSTAVGNIVGEDGAEFERLMADVVADSVAAMNAIAELTAIGKAHTFSGPTPYTAIDVAKQALGWNPAATVRDRDVLQLSL